MQIQLNALRCEKGEVDANLAGHRRALEQAGAAKCALAVFPEMSLTGSIDPSRGLDGLIRLDDPAIDALVTLTGELGVGAVFGFAERVDGLAYITQAFANGGRLAGVQRKRHLGEGEEAYRAADDDAVFELNGARFAIAICAESKVDRAFDRARSADADLVCFCAAPGLYERRTTAEDWQRGWEWWFTSGLGDAQRHARRLGLWIAIATQAGPTVDEDFPGLAALVDPRGEVVARLPDWREGSLVVEVPL